MSPKHRHVSANGITMHCTEQGEGPLVLLLHGFPETSYSWRHQLQPLAEAGYRVVAPDQRGYGSTDCPEGVDNYTILHLVGDVVGLIHALGEKHAVVVGHDWGAAIAWHTALLRPDLVRGVAGVSVPPMPRGPVPPISDARERFGEDFYQVYFQQPQAAEAEPAKDIPTTFRKVLAGTPTGEGSFLGRFAVPESLPGWLTEADIATFTGQFATTGFTGGLNWYRNLDRNWELTAAWQDAPIVPPALYVIGEHDFVRSVCPPDMLENPALVPDLRAVVDVPDSGHWTQQERPAEVNKALLDFLNGL
ncbi:alpha/beta hydrolase [Streptomyces sp. Je 1-4]|uniref:alpha/beta fold hydrolase n=1 Tax=Streptomyces TaxID=1883 RepID=UPI0021D9AFB1|nr:MULTISPECIES: alpha/beta hydrolase [unclassified Streptomyces]UYB39989.1 alpha/beta hydrolase [Streptomyces sp. Je 1-4]UZQ36060.1 alpha/beta hydrolase [Streptomyces sp. Je 1-4] [Streptomyces sp. Je 1-4 4N24]UZQ43478.1 alpha/beta hydrolase [Streptomyces sp. Je 1-4] [Streptomyces sp. Je 1-4 4N24_ara]